MGATVTGSSACVYQRNGNRCVDNQLILPAESTRGADHYAPILGPPKEPAILLQRAYAEHHGDRLRRAVASDGTGTNAVDAAQAAKKQLTTAGLTATTVEITPMIGRTIRRARASR